ncbi:MAG TPA: alpha/beta fold hydrolase [Rhizomicrobium sp.]|jgi:predicted dienelactone hydrolase|nr:alpha/beta fold hydrolase [Rhizomicrobium sp.]
MHRLLHTVIVPAVILAAAPAARGLDFSGGELLRTDNGLTFREWLPKDFASRRHDVPLVLFSHGFGGCAQQSRTLTQALADAGYGVLAPNHRDEGCERYRGGLAAALRAGGIRPEKPFTAPAQWTADTEHNRRDDLEALLDYALNHEPYKSAIDPARIAVMGHSLGGYAALGLGGAWPAWRDPRIKAVLALSPYAAPFVAVKTLSRLAVPVMYQTGTRDIGIGPVLLRQGGYEKTRGPKYLVVLQGAGHFAWTELNPAFQKTIASYAIAFLDRELRHRPAPLLDEKPLPDVAQYRHAP